MHKDAGPSPYHQHGHHLDDRPAPIHDTRRLGRCATPCKFDHAHDHLPESGEEDEQCGKSGEGQVSSALPKPCAKPSTTGRSGISMPACLASRFSRRHRASAAILRPSATSASTMDASSSSTTVTCRITPYMVPTRLAFKAPADRLIGTDWCRPPFHWSA